MANSKNNYRCYLINKGINALADQSFSFEVSARISEMRLILSTYDINKEDIVIQAVKNPLSYYHYMIDEIDATYQAKVEEIFWEDK